MKRTLKFRIWSPTNETCAIVNLEELASLAPFPSPEQVDQFTGLKDKFNQEIYEGDILHCSDATKDFFHQPVEFSIRGSVMGDEIDDAGYLQIPHNCEVVGNLRQSPELCEEEEILTACSV